MPSLRRSFSSPSVRSSPYPSSAATSLLRSRPTPRRPPGHTTAERRVLADIEWWRVYDGQCDPDLQDHAHDGVHGFDADAPLGGTVTLSAGGGPPETYSLALDTMQNVYSNSLSVAPYSPPSGRHGRDSSVESTPELPTSPLETVQLGLANSTPCPLGDFLPFPSSLMRVGGRPVHPLFGVRSVSVPSLSRQGTLTPYFADMGGDSFSLDQNLFQ